MNSPFVDRKALEMSDKLMEDFFVKPRNYEMLFNRNSMCIIGERGSGKTTLLKCMQREINEDKTKGIAVYLRFETAGMHSMNNSSMKKEDNIDNFSQIIHCIICKQLCEELMQNNLSEDIQERICDKVKGLIEDAGKNIRTIDQLRDVFETIRYRCLKNIRNKKTEFLLDDKGVLKTIGIELEKIYGEDYRIYLLLDEYENLCELQQQVINSMIKDATQQICYKICIRPNGFWTKATLAEREYLMDTHDFATIYYEEILGDEENVYALVNEICKKRLLRFFADNKIKYCEEATKIDNYLEITELDKEINRIENKNKYIYHLKKKIEKKLTDNEKEKLNTIDDVIDLQLIEILLNKNYSFLQIYDSIAKKTKQYINWKHNYKINACYIILDECGIRRNFGGLQTILKLTNNNIRMILAILDYAFCQSDFEEQSFDISERLAFISIKNQTNAIEQYAKIAFNQIEYIPKLGREEYKLINALGSLFRSYILDKQAKKFEVNNFTVKKTGDLSDVEEEHLNEILKIATMWGLLLEDKANKLRASEIYRYDDKLFILHPILSVRFGISHRRKQKTDISDTDIIGFISSPKETMDKFLKKSNDVIPGQLSFKDYLS